MEKNNLQIIPQLPLLANQYIIGIGASAGGLEAINELFDNMPSNTGLSFIVVQHLSPDHRSLMGELLSKHTSMPVFQAEDDIIPKPDCIYLIPIKKIITLQNGRLKLEDKIRGQQPNNVIDIFFESLAKDKGERTVGIILSGTGTDGTRGVQAIKKGGVVIIQDPITSQFDGMPNSAISSGYVDMILSPEMMAEEMVEFIKEAPLLRSFTSLSNDEEGVLLDILELIYKTTGHDFSNYKRPTIHRRLAKRMAERNIKSFSDYYSHLESHPEEITRLYKELLLHVTQFFRDEEAFKNLEATVIPEIISKKEASDVIKIWTVACSTGEEVYSLAMLLDECLHRLNKTEIELKIFATDISQGVIDIASRGVYTEEQIAIISPERVKKYFIKEGGKFRIIPLIRRMVVFARHDIVKDPPFSKIDLLTCRNMLIYMNPVLQKNVLQKFHFAINDNGYIFLGASENISVLKDAVIEIDKKWKIYKCVDKKRIEQAEAFSNPFAKVVPNAVGAIKARNALAYLPDIFKETLLDEYDYAGILIDRDFEVKQAIGNFKKFMDFPEGTFNFNILKLVPTDLSIALSTGIRKSIKDNERVIQKRIKVIDEKQERSITVIIKPYLVQKAYLQPFLFIILKEEEPIERKINLAPRGTEEISDTPRVAELELELQETKETLQSLLEEVESSNEELQSSNEEIISANEELQSTNEELQSLNEELHTVNAEHQLKIKELVELNDDLNNYFRNTDIGQILIDRKFIIRKFTPAATKQVNLIAGDIGRSIMDISTNMQGLDFINDIKSVTQSSHTMEREIAMSDGRNYIMRIAPYLRQNGSADGVVINFIDITEQKKLSNTLQAVFDSSSNGIVGLKAIRDANDDITAFEKISANKAVGILLGNDPEISDIKTILGNGKKQLSDIYKNVIAAGVTATCDFYSDEENRWFEIVAAKMMDGVVVTFADITDRKNAAVKELENFETLKSTSAELKETNFKLAQSNLDLLQFASVASHDLKEPLRKIQVFGNLLKDNIKDKLGAKEEIYLEKVIRSTKRMQVLIEDILTLSRLSKNDTPLLSINLNAVIEQIMDDLEVTIKEKNAEIQIGSLPAIKGVAGQVHQLFQNLISNAIKFSEHSPTITISEQEITAGLRNEFELGDKKYSAIEVRDNGIGFDQKYSEKIFGIFQRLDKTNYQGTGIGLAIVKKIVDNHKGFIKVTSAPGKGTSFVIIMPAK